MVPVTVTACKMLSLLSGGKKFLPGAVLAVAEEFADNNPIVIRMKTETFNREPRSINI
jgi:hypothetical protein